MPTVAAYTDQLKALLPRGAAWPREEGTALHQLLSGLSEALAAFHARTVKLVRESDPRTTDEMLTDWEDLLGLPDPCAGPAPTVDQRRAQVLARYRQSGGSSFAELAAYAAELGFVITIENSRAFRAGQGRAGQRLGGAEWGHVLIVRGPAGDTAVLECELQRLVPAHAVALFRFS